MFTQGSKPLDTEAQTEPAGDGVRGLDEDVEVLKRLEDELAELKKQLGV